MFGMLHSVSWIITFVFGWVHQTVRTCQRRVVLSKNIGNGAVGDAGLRLAVWSGGHASLPAFARQIGDGVKILIVQRFTLREYCIAGGFSTERTVIPNDLFGQALGFCFA